MFVSFKNLLSVLRHQENAALLSDRARAHADAIIRNVDCRSDFPYYIACCNHAQFAATLARNLLGLVESDYDFG